MDQHAGPDAGLKLRVRLKLGDPEVAEHRKL